MVVDDGSDPFKTWVRSNVPHVVRELFAGGAAGAVAKTCVAPLERTKILLMTGRCKSGTLQTMLLIFSSEGVRGLFRGNAASCLRIMPYAAIHFSVYEAYRRLLTEQLLKPSPPSPSSHSSSSTSSAERDRDQAERFHRGAIISGKAAKSAFKCDDLAGAAAASWPVEHLGNEEPPTPFSSSIDITATAVLTKVEEQQQREGRAVGAAVPQTTVQDHAAAQRQGLQAGPIVDLLAGSAAGATAVMLTYPLDLVRTRLAWGVEGAPRKAAEVAAASAVTRGGLVGRVSLVSPPPSPPPLPPTRIGTLLAHTVRSEGAVGLYRGLTPTLYGIMPYAGLKFYLYASFKQWYWETLQPHSAALAAAAGAGTARSDDSNIQGGGGGRVRLPVPYMLGFGGVSGLLAQTVTYPLDVIRRRMQVYGMQQETASSAAQRASLTTWAVGSTIVRQEGLRGLFRGLSLNYVKVAPSTAIGFTVYDTLKSYLGVTGNM